MQNFKEYFESYLGNKYICIEYNDKSISFLPMSQKNPIYRCCKDIKDNNIWNVYEYYINSNFDELYKFTRYKFEDNLWIKYPL